MLGANTAQKYYSALIYLTIVGGVIRKNPEKTFIDLKDVTSMVPCLT